MQTALDALSPLDPEERQRAITWLAETLEVEASVGTVDAASGSDLGGRDAGDENLAQVTPKQFLAMKEPTTDVERITCLAYYLTKVRGTNSFQTKELTELNTEAAGHRFSNAATTAKNAINQNGFLAQAAGGNRQITALGEKIVEAMPDRDAVAEVKAKAPKRRKRSAKRKAKQAKSS